MELSIHIRGPTWLKELAVYTPGPGAKVDKRNADTEKQEHVGHLHGLHHGSSAIHHAHEQLHKPKGKRAVGDIVTATIDGQIVHWTNSYAGPGATQGEAVNPSIGDGNASQPTSAIVNPSPQGPTSGEMPAGNPPSSDLSTGAEMSSTSTLTRTTALSLSTSTSTISHSTALTMAKETSVSSSGGWARQAYYNSGEAVSQGLTFLNHFGQADSIPA